MLRELLRALPNVVSLSRLAMAAWFLATDDPLTRALLVAAAAASDALDGWIARAAGVTSRAGALIDPLADRTFAILAVSGLLFDGVLTTLQYFILLARDIMTMVGFLVARIMPTLRDVPFQARPLGKVVTVLQFFSLFVAIARPAWAAPFVYLTGAAALASIVDYTMGLVVARRAVLATARADAAAAVDDAGHDRPRTPSALAWAWLGVPFALIPTLAQAQWRAQAWPEVRVAIADPARADVSGGASVPAGAYVRVLGALGAGVRRDGDAWPAFGRAELVARFSPDPFAQQRWAPYVSGGAELRCRAGVPCEPALLARVGVEGPLVGGRWRPAIDVGLGGGAQVAISWRRGRYGRR